MDKQLEIGSAFLDPDGFLTVVLGEEIAKELDKEIIQMIETVNQEVTNPKPQKEDSLSTNTTPSEETKSPIIGP